MDASITPRCGYARSVADLVIIASIFALVGVTLIRFAIRLSRYSSPPSTVRAGRPRVFQGTGAAIRDIVNHHLGMVPGHDE